MDALREILAGDNFLINHHVLMNVSAAISCQIRFVQKSRDGMLKSSDLDLAGPADLTECCFRPGGAARRTKQQKEWGLKQRGDSVLDLFPLL